MSNTLSLCLICKDEEKNIGNLLESVKGPLFDEIICCDTGSTDSTISILKKYTDKIYHFKWINDFSAARNFSFSKATMDFQLWLDADDVIKPEDYKKLLELKPKLHENDIYLMRYEYAHDELGNSICSFYRERIVRRSLNLKWEQPIHEYLPLNGKMKQVDIEVHHYRNHCSSERNLPMLEEIVKKDPTNARNIYYLGKELFDVNQLEKAKKLLTKYISMKGAWIENIYNAHLKLAAIYQTEKDFFKAKNHCFDAIKIESQKSDVYCKLGELSMDESNWKLAIHWYKIASNMERPEHILDIIEPKYYTWLPHLQLCVAYNNVGKIKEAALHNEIALKHQPQDLRVINNKNIFRANMGKDFIFDDVNVLKNIYEIYSNVAPLKQEILQDALKEAIKELETPVEILPPKFDKKLGWCVPNDSKAGTIRIRALNVCKQLKKEGYISELCNYETAFYYDCVVVGKSFNDFDINLIRKLKEENKKVICDLSEDILEYPYVVTIIKESDLVICCSEELRKKAALYNSNTITIEDAVEYYEELEIDEKFYKSNDDLKIFWFGYGGHSWQAEKLRYIIEDELNMKLYTIHEHPNADIPWNLDTVYEELKKADIIIVPANYKRQPCKSNNRLTQALALKKPIICEPLPAYKSIVANNINGLILSSGMDAEWRKDLLRLRDDSFLRKKLASNGFKKAKEYSLENISEQWLNVLLSLDKSISKEIIDVIIPTKNNKEILEECLKSFSNSSMLEEVYIVDNGDDNSVEEIAKKYQLPYEVRDL